MGCWHWFFFFSSRRRHTRCSRDWSSDVCSSDLVTGVTLEPRQVRLDTNTGPVTAAFVIAADGATGEVARLAGWGDGRHLIPALEYEARVDDATLDRFGRGPRFVVGTVP